MTQVLISLGFNRFEKVPLENGTRIKSQQEFVIEHTTPPLNALYQHWVWDGIIAESLIFVSDDVAEHDDDGLFGILTQTTYGKNVGRSGITICRSESGFTFVNFNFIA